MKSLLFGLLWAALLLQFIPTTISQINFGQDSNVSFEFKGIVVSHLIKF